MNQQKLIRKLSFLFLVFMVAYACKKQEQYSPEKQKTIAYETVVQNWKEQRLMKASKKDSANINLTVSHLDYTSAAAVNLNNASTLFLIRVKGTEARMTAKYLGIIAKNGNYTFDGLYQAGSIERIVSFFETNKLPVKDSILVWGLNAHPIKGWMTTESGKMLNLRGNLKLHGDKLTVKTTAVNPKPNDYQVAQEVCIDWYWTLYDEYGNVIRETYVYTTCESGGGGGGGGGSEEENYTRYAYLAFFVDPQIPGNDSIRVQGAVDVVGTGLTNGIFFDATWGGSIAIKKGSGYSYTQTSGTASYTNTPSPLVTSSFTGTMTTPSHESFSTGGTKTYTFGQAFSH
jgi:hypothetical protein